MTKKESESVKKENKIREAQALLMAEETKKEKACLDALNKVLQEYGYGMDTTKSRIILKKTPSGP